MSHCIFIKKFRDPKGQILAELLIAVAVAVIFVVFGAQLVKVSLDAAKLSKERGNALRLAQEAVEALRAIALGNDSVSQGWNRIYKPPSGGGDPSTDKGLNKPYYPVIATSTPTAWIIFTGIETVMLGDETYTRKVIIENVSRDANGDIESTYNSLNDDSGTQKVTVTVSRTGAPDTTIAEYFTRFINDSGPQSDWSGVVNCGPVAATSSANAACSTTNTTINNPVGSIKLQ